MLNKYLDRLESLLTRYRCHELVQFQGPTDERARFDDLIWHHIDPNTGRRTRFLCGRHGIRGKGSAGDKPEAALRYPYSHLVKVWIIETSNEPISVDERQARISCVRKLLTVMNGELYEQTDETITQAFAETQRGKGRVKPFLAFCADNGLMRPVRLTSGDVRDRTGHAQFDAAVEKLPTIESVLALGDIFARVFEPVSAAGLVRPGKQVNLGDAWVATYGLLGLASPNRLSAEVPVLPKQRLKTYAERGGEPVHYLDWKGSKGFKDNRNHVLAALADYVEKALNFFFVACEPARILCQFYENPNRPLKALLGDFKVAPERQKHLRFDEVPNLFGLGYALGFYGVDDCVPVLLPGANPSGFNPNSSGFAKCFADKSIHALTKDDRLSTAKSGSARYASISRLFGYGSLQGTSAQVFVPESQFTTSVSQVQDSWIRFFKKSLVPEFPYAYSTGEAKIRLADAHFCFLGHWFFKKSGKRGSGGKPLQQSPYAIVPLRSIGHGALQRLCGSARVVRPIFGDYGFPAEMSLAPHSLRHFGNTLADQSQIPKEIITAWSGRVDLEQTHTYIHSSHEDRSDRVRAVIGRPENDKREIRVVMQEALAQTTNLPASISSTGICTQDLNTTPCGYLNDFVSQCFMCPEACHVAGDVKAIEFFEKDHAAQTARLELVSKDPRLPSSLGMKKWFVIHSRNTHVLSHVIDLMKTLQAGLLIRYSPKASEFHLTDTNTKETRKLQCAIPDFEHTLGGLIAQQTADTAPRANPQLRSLLSSFGFTEEAA
jgi:hypothetical protein